ncbi:hypothetical protein SAMN02927903_01185 [Flavobacterium caeni]|uniref:Adenylosuccinate lyase n=2 Tax=Flavobacterium caeni TaxID=490189 RepID=A0A1G5F664_9FLAO|nr:hypothetical protein SAMN02927903_01185 [Flavobacterium caeni]
MDMHFYQRIARSTAHRPIRDQLSGLVFDNPHLLDDLIAVALDPSDQHHHKACWILELVMERHIGWLTPFLDQFCDVLPQLKRDGAVRSMSKICLFAAAHHTKTMDFLSENQLKKITEACFDWLISDAKVAAKAYAMRALVHTGRWQNWVYPELKVVLEMGYSEHSAAYQAACKEVLRKIAKK